MEERLATYRARKRIDELVPSLLKKVVSRPSMTPSLLTEAKSDVEKLIPPTKPGFSKNGSPVEFKKGHNTLIRSISVTSEDMEIEESELDESIQCPTLSWFNIFSYTVFFLFWVTLYGIAINLEFGIVFLIISALIFLWKNTRTGPKKHGEVSAYSVFNPNCEAIDGTLKAEQFEREIRYGAASVH